MYKQLSLFTTVFALSSSRIFVGSLPEWTKNLARDKSVSNSNSRSAVSGLAVKHSVMDLIYHWTETAEAPSPFCFHTRAFGFWHQSLVCLASPLSVCSNICDVNITQFGPKMYNVKRDLWGKGEGRGSHSGVWTKQSNQVSCCQAVYLCVGGDISPQGFW